MISYTKHRIVFLICLLVSVILLTMPSTGHAATSVTECGSITSIDGGLDDNDYVLFISGTVTGLSTDYHAKCAIAYWDKGTSVFDGLSGTGTKLPVGHCNSGGCAGLSERNDFALGVNLNIPTGLSVCYDLDENGSYEDCIGGYTNGYYSFHDDSDFANTNIVRSSIPLYAISGDYVSNFQSEPIDFKGPTGIYNHGDLILAAFFESGSLTFDPNSAFSETSVSFVANWYVPAFSPFYLYFYPDVEEDPVRLVELYPLNNSGSYNFSWQYTYPDTYLPSFVIGNSSCSSLTATGCTTAEFLADEQLTILDSNEQYNHSFYTEDQELIVGESTSYHYLIDQTECGTGSFLWATLYKGYPTGLAGRDSGTTLFSLSGSGILNFTEIVQPFSDIYSPRLEVNCGGTPDFIIYSNSVGVFEEDDFRYWLPETWSGGGNSSDWNGTGSGQAFWSDKHVYNTGEQVKLRWAFNVEFTPNTVLLHKDSELLPNEIITYTGATSLVQNKLQYGTISYNSPGEYNPSVLVQGSTGSKLIYLGGESVKNPLEVLAVTGEIPFCSDRGIFGYPPSSFKIASASNAPFLAKALFSLINASAKGVLVSLSCTFRFIEVSPMVSTIHDIIVPQSGNYTLPNSIFTMEIPWDDWGVERQFTISYVDTDDTVTSDYFPESVVSDDNSYLVNIVIALFTFGIALFILKRFFLH